MKTKIVHFYVQKNSNFGTPGAVIPFELARINEGNAFDLTSGIFRVSVPGIYHFDFSAVKEKSSPGLDIFLQVNGVNVGLAWSTVSEVKIYATVSLTASLRLAAGDTVKLFNPYGLVLHDNDNHHTHFTGWLVEEDLM